MGLIFCDMFVLPKKKKINRSHHFLSQYINFMRVNHRHHATNPSLDLRYTNESTTTTTSNNNERRNTTTAAAAAMSAAQVNSAAHLNITNNTISYNNDAAATSSGSEFEQGPSSSAAINETPPSRILVLSRARIGSKRSLKDSRIETISNNALSNLGKRL